MRPAPNKQLQRRSNGIAVPPRARHFILRSRRLAAVSEPPLNRGVSRQAHGDCHSPRYTSH